MVIGSAGKDCGLRMVEVGEEARSDEELIEAVRAGNDHALGTLLDRYRSFARAKARAYFMVGGEHEDIVQEGMIGLYKAIRDYDPDREARFRGFAELCITRQIITAIKSATRHKHSPLNNSVSFNRSVGVDGDSERCLADLLAAPAQSDPAEALISAERMRELQRHIEQTLSDLEAEVLRLRVGGQSHVEIAELLQRQVKSIDNAMQRIKRKLETHLKERQLTDAW